MLKHRADLRASGVAVLSLICSMSMGQAIAQNSPPSLYGRLNIGLEYAHASKSDGGAAASRYRVSNYRSVIGVKGEERLDAGLRAIFQLEGTVAPDTGAGAIAARDTRVGLAGEFGTIFAGNWSTPYNGASTALDPFFPTTAGYTSIIGNGSAASDDNVSNTSSFERRQQNSIHYWSPDVRGLSFRLARGLNRKSLASAARPSLSSAAVIFDEGPAYLSFAHERHDHYQGAGLTDRASKMAFAYRFSGGQIAIVADRLRYETESGVLRRTAYFASFIHQVGPHGFRFGAAKAGDGAGPSRDNIGFVKAGLDTGAIHYSAGYDYHFSKRSSAFVYFSQLRNNQNGAYNFAINDVDAAGGATLTVSAVGLRHSF